MATYPATNSKEASELLIDGSNQVHEVVNGDATTEVTTESGPIPSLRKAISDTFLFQDPLAWQNGSNETAFNQLRTFDNNLYWAPTATLSTPIPMGTTPIGDSNWKLAPVDINREWTLGEITTAQNDLVGGSIFKGANGEYVQNGDSVPTGTTHLRVLIGGKPTIVAMSPIASGTVSLLTETSATVGVTNVHFINDLIRINPTNIEYYGEVVPGQDHTSIFELALQNTDVINLIPGKTYRTVNLKPTSQKIFNCQGARWERHSNDLYEATGSSAALILSASASITVNQGEHGEGAGSSPAWSGSILIEGGDTHNLNQIKVVETWGGVFGSESQNGSLSATDVFMRGCVFDGCVHNTYLADIENLVITGYISRNSNRDGLKTYRNVRNITIDSYIIHDNGDGTIGQSMDGMDLFIAGFNVKIGKGYIYGNDAKGIDIKKATAGEGEAVQAGKYLIDGATIYGNKGDGISADVENPITQSPIPYLNARNCEIYGNGGRGAFYRYVDTLQHVGGSIYENALDGMRCENITSQTLIHQVPTRDNGGVGILVLDTCENADIQGCPSRNTLSGNTQTSAIVCDAQGVVRDNPSDIGVFSASIDGTCFDTQTLRGLDGSDTAEIAYIAPKGGQLTGVIITVNNTPNITIDVVKRGVDGTGSTVIASETVAMVAYKPHVVALNSSKTIRKLEQNQSCYVTITANSGSYTSGAVVFKQIS